MGAASKGVRPTKVKKILDTKPKAEPKKRKKRGVLKRKDVGKKKTVTKRLKKKKVTFSANKKAVGLRREQGVVVAPGRKAAYQVPGQAPVGALYGRAMPGEYRKRGDRQRVGWQVNAQGNLVRAPRLKRRIMVL